VQSEVLLFERVPEGGLAEAQENLQEAQQELAPHTTFIHVVDDRSRSEKRRMVYAHVKPSVPSL